MDVREARRERDGEHSAPVLLPHATDDRRRRGAAAATRRSSPTFNFTIRLRPSPRVEVAIGAGPSFFRISQALVDGVTYSDNYPYDAPAFTSVAVDAGAAAARPGTTPGPMSHSA